MQDALRRLYLRTVLRRPWPFVVAFLLMGLAGAWFLPGFKLSAGTSTMILESDDAKRVYDETRELFVTDDYVLVSVRPTDPWTPESVARLDALTKDLAAVPGVSGVTSPTTVPLFTSAADGKFAKKLLTDAGIDLERAKAELTGSQLYGRQLVSDDGSTFLLVVPFTIVLPEDRRRAVRALEEELAVREDPAKRAEHDRLAAELLDAKAAERARQRRIVEDVRALFPKHATAGTEIHASGLPALVVDMVNYLEHDIRWFGGAVAVFFLGTLFLLFRRPRYVLLPVLTCGIVVVTVLGATVAAGTETTVVTSNISSLLFIIGMAHSIHLVVKYREERALHPDRPYAETIAEAASAIFEPCLYTATTTAVGFASILTADIGPVKEFALWMAFGTMLAFGVSLVFLPAALAVLPPTTERAEEATTARRNPFLERLAGIALRRRKAVFAASLLLAGVAVFGATKLSTNTNFVNYFRSDTEVHQGIRRIDEVGGTMTLEVILHGDAPEYWLGEEPYARVEAVHRWFEARPEAGKVLSLVSFREEGKRILSKSPMAALAKAKFAGIVKLFEAQVGKEQLRAALSPVADPTLRTTRVYVRIRETTEGLDRTKLLADAEAFLASEPLLAPERAKPEGQRPVLTGMFVLFTNMVSSLVGSQVSSVWWCVLAVAAMLATLFRHAGLALMAMPPNLLPIALVLGTMGFAAIPLDLMTIMIASVSLGMAVDSSIHYVVRFRDELRGAARPEDAVPPTHQSIGKAILYTAFTVLVGFCVLVLSRFTPTVYFGLLTSIAMCTALAANLVLLPSLLLAFPPRAR